MFHDAIHSLSAETIQWAQAAQPIPQSGVANFAAMPSKKPSNRELAAQLKEYYHRHGKVIDSVANATHAVSKSATNAVRTLNDNKWTDSDKNPVPLSAAAIGAATELKGIYEDAINSIDPQHMFTSLGIGVGIDVQFLVGGGGGIGAIWDLMKREPVHGYAYAMVEMGLRLDISVNVQCMALNELPSQLTRQVLGMKLSASGGLGLNLTVFWNAEGEHNLEILGFATGIEIGVGAGATVAYGKLWGFT